MSEPTLFDRMKMKIRYFLAKYAVILLGTDVLIDTIFAMEKSEGLESYLWAYGYDLAEAENDSR